MKRKNSLECIICNENLKEPVLLPCGHTVCKTHEIEGIREKNAEIYCHECNEKHVIPSNGFPVNRIADDLLKRKLQKLDLGEDHTKAMNACQELSELLEKMRQIKGYPESEINEIVSDLKNKIDLRREILKKRIDDEAQQLIAELDELERSCLMSHNQIDEIKHSTELTELLDNLKKDYSKLKSELGSFERNEEKWKRIQSRCLTEIESLITEYETFKQKVFNDRLFEFELKQTKYCLDENEPLFKISFDVKLNEKKVLKTHDSITSYYFINVENRFGIKWKFWVYVPLIDSDGVEIYLSAISLAKKQTHYRVNYKLSISVRPGLENNLGKAIDFEYEFKDTVGYGSPRIIQLQQLKQNPELFDQKEQIFTANAIIKKIERIEI